MSRIRQAYETVGNFAAKPYGAVVCLLGATAGVGVGMHAVSESSGSTFSEMNPVQHAELGLGAALLAGSIVALNAAYNRNLHTT